jgi:hypothetical protein
MVQPDNWLTAEKDRYQRITDEKLREFQQTCQEAQEWLQNYVDHLLQGTGSELWVIILLFLFSILFTTYYMYVCIHYNMYFISTGI